MGGSEDLSDLEDSLLREVAQSWVPFRVPAVGMRLGGRDGRKFALLGDLGGGGMGQVFRASDEELQRVVALKFLLPQGMGTKEEARGSLLLQEARAIARFDHENIVRLFGVDEWSGAPWEPRVLFLVMECLEGESLGSLLHRERPGLRRALGIMHSVARGLAHAHGHHLVHRDLKPSNVFLTRQGPVKLLDFGLAHLLVSGGGLVPHLPTAGTPPYMSPEQWRGGPQDARTDLWATGVMLHELLTGELPYPNASMKELRARVLSPEPVPSIRERAPELPEEVARLVALLLEKEPGRRLSGAAVLTEQLARLEAQLGPWREEPLALGPQRRQVTLVSCGLVGLAQLPERPDPEDSLEMEEDFHRRCSHVIQRHGGVITHWLGQEVLACFGYPVAREDDSERAVRAGLELRGLFQEAPPRLPGHPLSVGVGIHTDSVVFTAPPQPSPMTGPSLQGEAPRVASRLAELAGPRGVVLGATTRTLVRGAFEAEPLVGAQGLEAWRVLCERRAVTRFERVLATGDITPLVGREPELQKLLALWAKAREGRGSVVLISGEAGIGKSRLIQELLGQVSSKPAYPIQAQCWMQLESSAFAPIIDLLWRQLGVESRALPRQELRGRLEAWLGTRSLLREPGVDARYIDGLLSLLSPASEEDVPSKALSLERQRERKQWLLAALRTLLSRMAEHQPVLAVMEDLHWADPSTLELLGALVDSVGRERLLVVLSARTGFVPPWPLGPGFHRLELGPLSVASTEVLVREVARGRRLPEDRVAQLVAKTEGVPLFIEELTRLLLERAPSSIPLTLHELLASRLDTLSPPQRALVWFGAGMGRRFTGALLAALTRRSEAELRGDLEALVAAGIFQPDDSDASGYQFHHALLQEVAWHSLPRGRRREFHRHIAHVLEARFPDVVGTRPEVLAHHHTQAGSLEQALHYRLQAVDLALQRWGNLEAIDHLRQALALLRSLPDASRRSGEEMQILSVLGIALMDTQGYAVPEVEQIHARALELFEREGDSLPYLDLMWMWLSTYFYTGGRQSLVRELAERLISLGQKRESKMLCASGYRVLSLFYRERGALVRSLALLERAAGLCREEPFVGFPLRSVCSSLWVDQEVYDLILVCIVRLVLGDVREAWRCGFEALARARRLNNSATLAYVTCFLAGAAQLQRDTQRTLEWAEEGMHVAATVWLRPLEAAARALRGWALARLGRHREGVDSVREGVEQLRGMGAWIFVPHFQGLLAEVQGGMGQVREGLVSVEEALACAAGTGSRFLVPELHRIRGTLLRMRGEDREAMRCFLRARVLARREQAALLELRATVALARLLQETGEEAGARRRLVRACHASRVSPEAVDFQEARLLLEQLSVRWEGAEAR